MCTWQLDPSQWEVHFLTSSEQLPRYRDFVPSGVRRYDRAIAAPIASLPRSMAPFMSPNRPPPTPTCSLRIPGSMLAGSAALLHCLRRLALHRGACGNDTRHRLSATRRRSSATRTTGGSTRSAISRRPRPPYLMSSTHNPTWPHPPAFCARRERSGALRFVVRRCALVGEISSEPYPCPCATLPAWLCPSNEVD